MKYTRNAAEKAHEILRERRTAAETEQRDRTLIAAIDGVTMAGIILLGGGLLCLVAHFGAFDTMSYGFRQMFTSMFAKEANKFNDMAEYKEDRNKKRAASSHYYYVMMIVSLLFFIVLIALEIYKSTLY